MKKNNIHKGDFWKIFITTSIVMILYFISVRNGAQFEEFTKDISMFNVTFSVGLAAMLVAVLALLQKSKIKELKEQTIQFVVEFVLFVLVNFLLLFASYTNVNWIIHSFSTITICASLVILFGTISFLRECIKKFN